MGRTGIYACGESVSRRNSLESVALFSLKQEAPASIGGSTFTCIGLTKISWKNINVSRTDITDRVYTHKTPSQLIEAVNRL